MKARKPPCVRGTPQRNLDRPTSRPTNCEPLLLTSPHPSGSKPGVNPSYPWQFLPGGKHSPPNNFNGLRLASRMQNESAYEVARNGAFLKINFGQRFS